MSGSWRSLTLLGWARLQHFTQPSIFLGISIDGLTCLLLELLVFEFDGIAMLLHVGVMLLAIALFTRHTPKETQIPQLHLGRQVASFRVVEVVADETWRGACTTGIQLKLEWLDQGTQGQRGEVAAGHRATSFFHDLNGTL